MVGARLEQVLDLSGVDFPPRYREPPGPQLCVDPSTRIGPTAYLRTKILDFRGFDSSIILILSGGILMSIGILPESSSQGILVGLILVGRSGVVSPSVPRPTSAGYSSKGVQSERGAVDGGSII